MTGEPRRIADLLPEHAGEYPQFAEDDGRPWAVVLHGVADCGRGAVLVIYEPGMTYARAIGVAAGQLPQQHTHVVPVRTPREDGGP